MCGVDMLLIKEEENIFDLKVIWAILFEKHLVQLLRQGPWICCFTSYESYAMASDFANIR